MEIRSLDYFMKLPLGAGYEIGTILSNPKHEIYNYVLEDMASISKEKLNIFCEEMRIERLLAHRNNKDLARRQWYLEYHVDRKIKIKRVKELKKKPKISSPNCDDFDDIEIDKNGLVLVKDLELYNFGLCHNEYIYQMCPMLNELNSGHWLSNIIIEESFKGNRGFRIRIDPLMKVAKTKYQPYFQLMNIYGKKLDWSRLKGLRNEEFGQWLGGGLSTSSIHISDYVWSPSGNEIHFTCEELPKSNYLDIRGSRYFHAIFEKSTGKVIHCDGAVRFYSDEEYQYRLNYHVRNPEVRKIGNRVKIFQIDEAIDEDLFMRLATNFFVWNEDAIGYFN